MADNTDEAVIFRMTQCCGNPNREPLYMDWTKVLLAKDGGNVGIGTTAPGSPLHVKATTSDMMRLESSGEADIRFIAGGTQWEVGSGWGGNVFGADGFYLYRGGGRLMIDSDGTVDIPGNLGLGTESPAAKLDVRGAVALNDNRLHTRTGGDDCHYFAGEWNFPGSSTGFGHTIHSCNSPTRIIAGGHLTGYFDDNGNVGIGTDSPGAKLDVAGDVKVRGRITADNLTVNGNLEANAYKHDANACVLSPQPWTGNGMISLHQRARSAGRNMSGEYNVCPDGYHICPAHIAKRYCGPEDVRSGTTGGNPYGRHMWVTGWTLSNCGCVFWDQKRTRSLYTQHYGVTRYATDGRLPRRQPHGRQHQLADQRLELLHLRAGLREHVRAVLQRQRDEQDLVMEEGGKRR